MTSILLNDLQTTMNNPKNKPTTQISDHSTITERTQSMGDNPSDNESRTKRRNDSARSSTLGRSLTNDWRLKAHMSHSMRGNFLDGSARRIADLDDEEGKAQFFLILLFQR